MRSKLIAAGLLAAGATLTAQTQATQDNHKEVHVIVNGVGVSQSGMPDTMTFVANQFHFDAKPIVNAPYSAESVTESAQVLTDGNRISRKTTAAVYRDGQGRTRREESLPAMGSEPSKKMIFINDPVAKVSYILDPDKKTARKIPIGNGNFSFAAANSSKTTMSQSSQAVSTKITMDSNGEYVMEKRTRQPNGEETVERKTGAEAKAEVSKMNLPIPPTPPTPPGAMSQHQAVQIHTASSTNSKVDQLGKRTIEGLECTGVKTTMTLAAGTIGNERAIDTIQETWTSADLQTAIQTRRSDPRSGDTTFKLTNVRRAEPSKNLFEVPSDYKIEEGPSTSGGMTIFNQRINKD